ncbi:nucleotide pyrophosphohydrolase [Mesohalobacter halotolerans]|uniref:Nucleotide pyrophosphohydrolase n=1 Tax=Mesohalobacter halotolerans TaxID=1883405 RepID=A0A4U5TT82_9FLAO|nr:nucleotide pyrophosphohydrolase [Mesohalobacter halotolerans]TKS57406.1 nucleotide pyrophosphohydrolase [Mesohalobacter halotolerans]
MISIHFPRNDKEASVYGGYLNREGDFEKLFPESEFDSIQDLNKSINQFLIENAYDEVNFNSVQDTIILDNKIICISRVDTKASILLTLKKQPNIGFTSLILELLEFRQKRDWEQFHKPKDLALALSIEASELLECFLWKDIKSANRSNIKNEIADILSYLLYLANDLDIDLEEATLSKIKQNEIKYPVSKSKGKSTKYNQLK